MTSKEQTVASSTIAKSPLPPPPPPPPPPLPPQSNVNDTEAVASIIIEDDDGSDDETSQSYNKLKYHSMKMDLNLRILREEMGNLQDSGNSLSRQIASMYRSFKEMKEADDENDDDDEKCSDYDQYSDDDIDSQCADAGGGDRDDTDLDTEDDVNKMSDLETDYSSRSRQSNSSSKRKKQQKRPPPLQLEPAAAPVAVAQPVATPHDEKPVENSRVNSAVNNVNAITRENILAASAAEPDIEREDNSDFYPDFDTSSSEDCSHCLCCSSIASYSGRPWKYVDKSGSSAQEYESDSSSEYCSDSDEDVLLASTSSMPLHKRLSPFFYQDCYAEVEEEVPGGPDGESDGIVMGEDREKEGAKEARESLPKKRMSPVGCESPKSAGSGGSSLAEPLDDKCRERHRIRAPARTDIEPARNDNTNDQVKGVTKTANSTTDPQSAADVVMATDDDDEGNVVPPNIKDRIKNFEVNNKAETNNNNNAKLFKRDAKNMGKHTTAANANTAHQRQENVSGSRGGQENNTKQGYSDGAVGSSETERSPPSVVKAKPPPIKAKPQRHSVSTHSLAPATVAAAADTPTPPMIQDNPPSDKTKQTSSRHVSKSTFRVQTPEGERKKKPRPSSTIEIPVQYLSGGGNSLATGFTTAAEQGGIPLLGGDHAQLTFQVRPANIQSGALNGPLIITSSPKPRRAVSKRVVKLSSASNDIGGDNDNDDVSEQSTLRPEPVGGTRPKVAVEGTLHHNEQQQQQQHPICPHCHKKSVSSEERKRNVQVLQLQPVSDADIPSSPTTPTPQTASVTFTPPQPTLRQRVPLVQPARIIKIIPSGRQQLIMQRQPTEEPRSVHLRLNMGGPQGVPIRIGDYIRIPTQPGQARGVRVVFN